MKTLRNTQATLLNSIIACFTVLAILAPAVAQSASAIAKGYTTDDPDLVPGMVAALSSSGNPEDPKVERASKDDDTRIIGIATTPEDDLVTIASGVQSVYVQTTGEVGGYVTDINGQVKAGDLLVVSPLKGILMKSDNETATIVGIAMQDFDDTSAETKSIQGDDGTRDVKVGKISINLDHKAASNQQADETDSSLERIGQAVVGKEVGEIQVLAAFVIFFIVLVAEGGIIYGAVSSGVTALGRNPMARTIILKEMLRVIVVALMVLFVGLAAIYVILWI